jgi:ribose 5-phosphate isomerase B
MRIAIGSDHAGYHLKTTLAGWLADSGYEVTDLGTYTDERVDYPHYGALVGRAVASGQADRGVAVCGSGQGICMAANKVPGVRGGVIRDVADAEMTRRHNDANVACFGERFTEPDAAIAALRVFLETEFEGGRHEARVEQLGHLDQTHGASEV